SRDTADRAPRRARAGRATKANWSGGRWAERAGIAWISALCAANAWRTTCGSRDQAEPPATPRGESAQIKTANFREMGRFAMGSARAFHLFRRGALGYDGAGGRSAPRRRSIGG